VSGSAGAEVVVSRFQRRLSPEAYRASLIDVGCSPAHRRCGSDQVAYRERQKRSRDVESKWILVRPTGHTSAAAVRHPDARPIDAGVQIAARRW
jgi:hypothetical protein